MRTHIGMRPHDILVLLKMTHAKDKRQVSLASDLHMSQSEISDSLSRSVTAGLIDAKKKTVYVKNLLEFIQYGIKYVYPVIPGRVVRGIPTASSVSPLKEQLLNNVEYVWAYHKGNHRGESISPLHENVNLAVEKDKQLHIKLALLDAIRLRNPRESQLAIDLLRNRLIHE